VPHAGTSGHDVDYMKPRRVLCDVLSHSCVRHLSRHHCARNGGIALTNYCGAHVRNGVIRVIPAIPACPVRSKSGHSANARVYEYERAHRSFSDLPIFPSVALARVLRRLADAP